MTHENVADSILLDEKYSFNVLLSVGLEKGTDFYLRIEFQNLSDEDFKKVVELTKKEKSISIKSKFLIKENYDISNIVVVKFNATSGNAMIWETLSDNDFDIQL